MNKSDVYTTMIIIAAVVSIAGGLFLYLHENWHVAAAIGCPAVVFFINLAWLSEQFHRD